MEQENRQVQLAQSAFPQFQASNELVEFKKSLQSARIGICEPDDLTDSLQYAMMLVGIRASQLPTQAEFDFIKQFLLRNFRGNTLSEIKLAFDLAIAGKLNLGESGANCFGNFTCEYVGKVMSAYKKWATLQVEMMPHDKPLEVENKPSKRDVWLGWLKVSDSHYQSFLDGKFKINFLPVEVYDALVVGNWLNENDYLLHIDEAKELLRSEAVNEAKEKYIMPDIAKVLTEFYEGLNDSKVTAWSKRIAVMYLFEKMKN